MSYRNFPCEWSFLYFSEQSSRNLNLVSPRIRLHELLKTSTLTMAGREKSAGQRERERGGLTKSEAKYAPVRAPFN